MKVNLKLKSRKGLEMKRTLCTLCTLFALLAAAPAVAQVNYTWTEPTTGSPVAHYNVFWSSDGVSWVLQDTTHTNAWSFSPGTFPYQISVSGVDASQREGPRSDASDPDIGPPGQPGKPSWTVVVLGIVGGLAIGLFLGFLFGRKED
jgi:hypothetical protein